MQILNEMYINPKLANILANGVENIHWKLVNKKNRTIDYPKGLSVTTSGYPASAWEWPNEMITYIWADSKPTLWKDTVEFNKNAISSPLSGFTWNNKNVLSEIASCNTVVQKYKNALECGELDPSVYIPRFIHELKVAGVDTIIEEKQRQVDLWLEDQNNK
jgi:putative aldouronate transport system substrate-binding protein